METLTHKHLPETHRLMGLLPDEGYKSNQKVAVYENISPEHIEQLISNTRDDSLIKKATPRDEERFPNQSVAERYFGDRKVYTLIDESSDELAGIIWFGKKHWSLDQESPSHTYAIRVYEKYRGQGYGTRFSELVVDHFLATCEDEEFDGLWLEANNDNEAALHLYDSTGWERVGVRVDKRNHFMGRIVMKFDDELEIEEV